MMLTMKVNKLNASYQTLMEVGRLKLPRKLSYTIARNLAKMEPEVKVISAQATDIIKRYAELDEEGEVRQISTNGKARIAFRGKEAARCYIEEVNELDESEVTLELYTVSAEELDRCDEEHDRYDIITPIQESTLSWMFCYDSEA